MDAVKAVPETYRNDRAYPFCPGCGHGTILDRLDAALKKLGLDPREVVLVSDIGCVGLSDQYFTVHAFHGLHGRSVTYAQGIKLVRPEAKVIVLMGDGGCGIGGHHLISAARRNVDLTVLVFNNLNFGMTGGEHSVTTPLGARTATSRWGNLEHPMDVCATVGVNGAGYVWRGTSFDKDLVDRIAEAIQHPGFALLEIWELCTAYYVPNNALKGGQLRAAMEVAEMEAGLLYHRPERPPFGRAYREATEGLRGQPTLPVRGLEPRFPARLEGTFRFVVAGAAGGRVRSSARLFATAAVLSGLYAAQSDDYPVTVKSGHSVSELVLSPRPIRYPAVEVPDALLVVAPEGLAKVRRHLERMGPEGTVLVLPEFADLETRARKVVLDLSRLPKRPRKGERALAAVALAARHLDLFPYEALLAAARRAWRPEVLEANLPWLEAVAEA